MKSDPWHVATHFEPSKNPHDVVPLHEKILEDRAGSLWASDKITSDLVHELHRDAVACSRLGGPKLTSLDKFGIWKDALPMMFT